MPGFHAPAGSGRDGGLVGFGDGPAAGEQHLPLRGGHAQQVPDEVVAGPGSVNADQEPPPEPSRDLAERRGEHLLVVGEGVRAGVPWPQEHGQALAGIDAPGGQRVEAVPFFQVGAAPSLSNSHRFAATCARWCLRRPGLSGGRGALEAVAVNVVGEVADQAGVVHAECGGGELGVEVVDELGDPGLPAGGRRGARGREQAGEVGADRRGWSPVLVAWVTITCGFRVASWSR